MQKHRKVTIRETETTNTFLFVISLIITYFTELQIFTKFISDIFFKPI